MAQTWDGWIPVRSSWRLYSPDDASTVFCHCQISLFITVGVYCGAVDRVDCATMVSGGNYNNNNDIITIIIIIIIIIINHNSFIYVAVDLVDGATMVIMLAGVEPLLTMSQPLPGGHPLRGIIIHHQHEGLSCTTASTWRRHSRPIQHRYLYMRNPDRIDVIAIELI